MADTARRRSERSLGGASPKSPSADTKIKSSRSEKKGKHDDDSTTKKKKKDDPSSRHKEPRDRHSEPPPLSEKVRVGHTLYRSVRTKDETGAFGGGAMTLWVPEGHSASDSAAWAEVPLGGGALAYAPLHAPTEMRWALPDLAGAHQADAALGGASGERRVVRAVISDRPPAARLASASIAGFLCEGRYAALLRTPEARRGAEETAAAVALGVPAVLCAVRAVVGRDGPRSRVLAVARGTAGGFCLVFLDAARPVTAFPLLADAEVVATGAGRAEVRIDGVVIPAAMSDAQQREWLQDGMRVAMAAMYGDGTDMQRVTAMRGRSVELAAQFDTGMGETNAVAAVDTLAAALPASVEEQDATDRLRRCLRTPAGRDAVARCWLASPGDVRVVEAMVVCPTPYGDAGIAAQMQQRLAELCNTNAESYGSHPNHDHIDSGKYRDPNEKDPMDGAGDAVRKGPTRFVTAAARLYRTDAIMQKWRTCAEVPEVPLERCFDIPADTPITHVIPSIPSLTRTPNTKHRNTNNTTMTTSPSRSSGGGVESVGTRAEDTTGMDSGVYLIALYFCRGHVLIGADGGPIAELVQAAPTASELKRLAPDSLDVEWMLHLGGMDPSWADERLDAWAAAYEERGDEPFRAQFLRAANRLRHAAPISRLGCILDAPLLLPVTRSALIITTCAVEQRESVPATAGVWCDMRAAELPAYVRAGLCTTAAQIACLPCFYRRGLRYMEAARRYLDSLSRPLEPGFYVGFILATVCSTGALVLVPEECRHLPPLVRAGAAAPSLAQWRWLQSLNHRRRTTHSFGFPSVPDVRTTPLPSDDDAPFETRVAFAIASLEAAVGLPIEQFYDLELFTLNEEHTVHAFFAVAYYPPPLPSDEGDTRERGQGYWNDMENHTKDIPSPPIGLVPMTFKLVRVINEQHLRRFWPRVYSCLAAEADVVSRKLCVTTQPFTADEAVRLAPAGDLMRYAMDLDRYALLLSFLRPIVTWLETDGVTLVSRHATRLLDSDRPVEEVIDVAVANQVAATAGPGATEMRALLLELRGGGPTAWASVLRRVQDMDAAIDAGESHHATTLTDESSPVLVPLPLRSYDEVPIDISLSTPAAERPATFYDVPCTLEEFLAGDDGPSDAYLCAREVVEDLVDLAVAGGEVAVIGRVAATMVACVTAAEDAVDGAALEACRAAATDTAWAERCAFLRRWAALCHPPPRQTEVSLAQQLRDTALEAETAPLFCAGSSFRVGTPADGVRVCLARAETDASRLQELLRMANSAQHAIELAQCLHQLVEATRRCGGLARKPSPPSAPSPRRPAAPSAPSAAVLLSREGREVPIPAVDPLRAMELRAGDRLRLPNHTADELRLFAAHMRAPAAALAQQLREMPLPTDPTDVRRLFDLCVALRAPLLVLRLLPSVFGAGGGGRMGDAAAASARAALDGGFLFAYGVRDLVRLAALGGAAVSAGLDVLWWARGAAEGVDVGAGYGAFAGVWAKVYAEARVRSFLRAGAAAVRGDERALWAEALGPLVEFVSLRGEAAVGDAEVALLAATCPDVRSLDLAGTGVTTESAQVICGRLTQLVECSVAGSRVSREAAERISDWCAKNAQKKA